MFTVAAAGGHGTAPSAVVARMAAGPAALTHPCAESLQGVKVALTTADAYTGMWPTSSLEQQAVIADTLKRPRLTMTGPERVAEVLLSAGFAATVVLLWGVAPPGRFALAPALVCLLLLAVAGRIRIDTPFGWTLPTQLAFVPLLFATPTALVPIAVAAAMALARLPDIATGRMSPSRLVQAIPNAWFAVGPVAVFAIAGVSPGRAGPALLIAALAAQFIVDFAASGLRYAIGRGATLAEQSRESWVYVVDAALSGVALLVAEEIHRAPIAVLAPLPLLGLIAMFARERRQRLESLIELNSAYRLARDEAVEASNMKSAFLSNVSHEIRTPMNGVMGMNELLLDTPLNDEQRGYAEQVERSGEQMLTIINDILDISKIESGRLELDVVDFDLHELIEQACVPADLEARTKDLQFHVQIDPQVPQRVRGDGGRVRQVILNLAVNAVKFTEDGSVAVHVAASPSSDVDNIRFEVIDTGIGVDPLILQRMFEPFMQADVSTTRRYGGNGLGLAIAKELVERMGGEIGGESEPGCGSTFWFELALPKAAISVVPSLRERDKHLAAGPVASTAALILVVEDSPVNRVVARRVLERCGFVAHVVNDGREALEELATRDYDAVLMDCQMPEMDGYEATRELRRREGGSRHTPVIAMTAHAMTGDRDRCLAAGMDDYITKPMRSHQLAEVLRHWTATAHGHEPDTSRALETGELLRAGSISQGVARTP